MIFNHVDIDIKKLNFQVPENMPHEILIILRYTRPVLKAFFTFIAFSIWKAISKTLLRRQVQKSSVVAEKLYKVFLWL